MIPALSQVGTLPTPILTELEDYESGNCQAIELWMTKVEEHLESHSVESFADLLEQHQLNPVSAAFQGGLLASQGERRNEAWKLLERRLGLCRKLNIGVLVVACDVPDPMSAEDGQRVQVSLTQLAQLAAQTEQKVALEFQAKSALGNNLQTAAAMVEQARGAAQSTMLGLCLDAFHFHIGPSKIDDLQLLTNDNLFLVQLCDLADVPRELATDQNRILPGDGEISLDSIVARLRELQYQGPITAELLNPQLWQVPSRQFAEIAMSALRAVLGE